jgi:hypothetical protein
LRFSKLDSRPVDASVYLHPVPRGTQRKLAKAPAT